MDVKVLIPLRTERGRWLRIRVWRHEARRLVVRHSVVLLRLLAEPHLTFELIELCDHRGRLLNRKSS